MESISSRGPQLGWRQEKKLNVRVRQDSGCYDSDSQHGSPDIFVGQMEDITFKWVEQTQSVFDQEKERMKQLSDKCKFHLENARDAEERDIIMQAWKKGIKEIAVLTRDLIDCIAQDVIELVDDAGKSPMTSSWELEQIEEEVPDEEFHFYMLSPKTAGRRRRRNSYENQLKTILSGVKKHKTGHVLIPKTRSLPRAFKKNLKKLSQEHHMEWNAVSIKIKSGWDSDEDKKPEEKEEESVEDIYEEWREWNLKDFFGPKWKDDGDLEPEDIMYDWLHSLKDTSTKGDMNDIFWDIELDEDTGHRRLSEELKGLPIADQPDVIHDCCELLEGKFASPIVPARRKRQKDYVNIFKSWRHNLDECRPKKQKEHVGKMRPPKKTRHITRIFDKDKTWYHFPRKYPKVRDAPEAETIFGDWNWNFEVHLQDEMIEKSNSFEWICFPRKPSIRQVEEFYSQWKWNLNEQDQDLPEDILNDYRHNYTGPIVPGEILFQDWPFIYGDVDDEGYEEEEPEGEEQMFGRRKSYDEEFDLEETNLRPYFSPKRQRLETLQPEDYFEDWRHEIEEVYLSDIGRQFQEVIQSGHTVAQILDKQFEEVKAFELWPTDTARELLQSRREFNWLRNIIKNKRSRQKELNEVAVPEKWFTEWRWQMEETTEEQEDIFEEWRHNLDEESDVEDIFHDWLQMIQRRFSLRRRDSAPMVWHPVGSHRSHKKLAVLPAVKANNVHHIPKMKHLAVTKHAKQYQKLLIKCHPKQPQWRGMS